MSEHTKEPWKAGRRGNGVSIVFAGRRSDNETIIANCSSNQDDEANARRIVACVNACEGIKTETLEQYVSGIVNYSVEQSKIEMIVQRDNEIETLLENLTAITAEAETLRARVKELEELNAELLQTSLGYCIKCG